MTTNCTNCLDSPDKPHYRFSFSDFENNYLNELKKNRGTLTRVVWGILFLAMIVFATYIAIQLLMQYFQYDSYNLDYSQLATSYILPSITICNVNKLNYTLMKETPVTVDGEDTNVYKMYKNLLLAYSNPSEDTSEDYDFKGIDDLDLFEDYRMNPSKYYIHDLSTFAKSPLGDDFIDYAYTSNGMCLELNDDHTLVQKVGGVHGGLVMVLDTVESNYLPQTQDKGFRITLRDANETVLDQQYGFLVAPGHTYYINVKTTSVTRLSPDWGTCQDTDDILTGVGSFSLKECFLNQVLWMHPKLRDMNCGCYPWHFYQRYFEDDTDRRFNEDTKWRLIKYWTETLESKYSFEFTETCQYVDTYRFTSNHIETLYDIASVEDCITGCKEKTDCRYFMYSTEDNDIMKVGECQYYKKYADMAESASTVDTKGKIRGDINCLNMDKCTPSQTVSCDNEIMKQLMFRDGDEDADGKSNLPPLCYEPCSYEKYSYTMSSTEFPTASYWDEELSQTVDWYDDYDTAKRNLVKLVFYTDVMETRTQVQTASYEVTSFISEVGGLTDLFMGLSFYTFYQIIEWILTLIFSKKCKVKESPDNIKVETIEL